jgi:inorganic pyrophosphatase
MMAIFALLSRLQKEAVTNTTTLRNAIAWSSPLFFRGNDFPYDFCFVPSTLGDDGDPLDVLILMDSPVIPGCVVTARLIGAIEAKQRPKDGDWTRNYHLIAVATHAQLHNTVHSLSDMRPHLLDKIKEFFIGYNKLRNRKFKPQKDAGPRKARALLEAGIKAFKKT